MTNQISPNDIKKHTLQDKSGKAFCTFTEHGATLLELQLFNKDRAFQTLDGFKTEEQLKSNDRSRNIFLVPFPNRIRDGAYSWDGVKYQLPINKKNENNAIHGFIWNKIFEIAGSDNSVTLSYSYSSDYPGFPFPFLFKTHYQLSPNSLTVTLDVLNTGKTAMPLGLGWHPYFTFHKPINSIQLQLPDSSILDTDNRLIPTGKREPYKQFKSLHTIGNTNFDTAFEVKESGTETKLFDAETENSILIQQDEKFKYLQVYIPTERNSIAIEPMTCPANAFNTGEGLIRLESGASFSGKIQVLVG